MAVEGDLWQKEAIVLWSHEMRSDGMIFGHCRSHPIAAVFTTALNKYKQTQDDEGLGYEKGFRGL